MVVEDHENEMKRRESLEAVGERIGSKTWNMDRSSCICRGMDLYVCIWIYMCIYGYVWIYMCIYGYICRYVCIYRYIWI